MKHDIQLIAYLLILIFAISSCAPQQFDDGVSVPVCNMFGCDCVPPPGSKCCIGYGYDPRSKQCRPIIKT